MGSWRVKTGEPNLDVVGRRATAAPAGREEGLRETVCRPPRLAAVTSRSSTAANGAGACIEMGRRIGAGRRLLARGVDVARSDGKERGRY